MYSVKLVRLSLFAILLVITYYLLYKSTATHEYKESITKTDEIYCYKAKDVGTIQPLDYNEPPRGKSIFFHETSCKSHKNGTLKLTNRQACAVESAARQNPNFQVFLLYISPGVFPEDNSDSHRYFKALQTYPNIKIRHVNYEQYVTGTLVEALYKDGLLGNSTYAISHASDVIRFLSLWRFGGIYLDMDMVVIKSLEELPLNFAGLESEQFAGSSILRFEPNGLGHDLATQCLEDLQRNFNGQKWNNNGPGVVTRLVEKLCKSTRVDGKLVLKEQNCQGYQVYGKEYFYPIVWQKWRLYFKEEYGEIVRNLTKNSYTLHMWNSISGTEVVSVDSKVPYVEFVKQVCPKVFQQCKTVF